MIFWGRVQIRLLAVAPETHYFPNIQVQQHVSINLRLPPRVF
jgi:hypothetical protein